MIVYTNKDRKTEYDYLSSMYDLSEVAIFDIETTGFAAETTKLYLIGCAVYDGEDFVITQWFNDDGESEEEILNHEIDEVIYDRKHNIY